MFGGTKIEYKTGIDYDGKIHSLAAILKVC